MLRICSYSIFFLLLISRVVDNQEDYQDNSDEEHPSNEEYPSIEENEFNYVDGLIAYRSPNPRGISGSRSTKASSIGIVNGVLGIIAGGKCIIKCALSIHKICVKIIDCLFSCILPGKVATWQRSAPQNNDDSDITIMARYSHSSDLTAKDVVKLFECLQTCLTRYLPRSLDTLTDWLSCIIRQCICYA